MLTVRLSVVIAAGALSLAAGCKQSSDEKTPPEQPKPTPAEPSDAAPAVAAEEPAAAPPASPLELVQRPTDGFEITELVVGDSALWVIEQARDSELHRVLRYEYGAAEPVQVGVDGRYQAMVLTGDRVEVRGDRATHLGEGGFWVMHEPGKQSSAPAACFAVYDGHCYNLSDELAITRWPFAGGRPKQVAKAVKFPDSPRKPWPALLIDDGVMYRLFTRGNRIHNDQIWYVDVIPKAGAKPIQLQVEHLSILGAKTVFDGYLYYTVSVGTPVQEYHQRIRPTADAQPERAFGGRKYDALFVDGGQLFALYTASRNEAMPRHSIGRVDPDSNAYEIVADLGARPGDRAVYDGYFYFIDGGAVWRTPLRP